jgi:tRNA-2-methylthio-N6-dimethylallyladenosine synthase
LIARAARLKGHVLDTEFPSESKFDALPRPRSNGPSAFLTIQEGCDKFCSFCVVPYTRGAENSRPVQAILEEAEQLVASGACEITLLGQNVNAYRGADRDGRTLPLAALLCRLSEISGLERLRYTTSHPRDMDDALIEAHAGLDKLMPFLHLPIQSGSDRILAGMNRQYRAAEYLALVARIRAARRDIALSSDFIVGFPGETEADFQRTLDLVDRVGFAQAYSFKYSPRPGTPAAALPGQIADEVKSERLARLQARLQHSALAFNEAQIGCVLPVLFDRSGRKTGQAIGRSPYLQSVVVEDRAVIGRILPARIIAAGANSLIGEVVLETEAQCAA